MIHSASHIAGMTTFVLLIYISSQFNESEKKITYYVKSIFLHRKSWHFFANLSSSESIGYNSV